jgi:hypothetical protein
MSNRCKPAVDEPLPLLSLAPRPSGRGGGVGEMLERQPTPLEACADLPRSPRSRRLASPGARSARIKGELQQT